MITLLYVDDEPELLELGRLFLERSGDFTVLTASSAAEGLELLGRQSFDAIISDYQMPVMDGIEFLKRVRSQFDGIPFILFTGRGREEVVIEAINNGADFYLQKGGDAMAQFAELRHKILIALERRQAVDALRNSEQRLSDIINFLPDATFAINTEGKVIAWNKALEVMSGIPASSMIGKGDYEYALAFFPERRPILIDLIQEPLDKPENLGYAILQRDGSVIVAETNAPSPRGVPGVFSAKASLLFDKNGVITGAIESVRDITESKKNEVSLRERQAELKSIFAAAPGGIGVSVNKKFREINQYFCDMLGYSEEELLTNTSRMIYPDDEEYRFVMRERDRQIQERGIAKIETRWQRKDGTILDILLSSAPLIPGDLSRGLTFTAIDITDRKRVEDELRIENEKNRGLMDHANDAIFIVDAETRMLIDANKKAQDLVGKTPDEIRTWHYTNLLPPAVHGRVSLYFDEIIRDGSGSQMFPVLDREGRQVPVIINATAISQGERQCIMGILHDISEIQMTQEALEFSNRKLNLLSEITRHDIRNKLTVIGGYLELVKDRPEEPEYSMYVRKITDTFQTISENIEFTRVYQNLGSSAPIWQNVHEAFFHACTQMDIQRVCVQSDVGGIDIFADPLLEQAFYNLIENVLKHGNKVTTIRLSARANRDSAEIIIEDNGVGIPPFDKENIFTKGFGKNTGLGLFLVKEILSITGITIRENGEYRKGARFELVIPRGAFRFPGNRQSDRCHILTHEKP
ncbi:PAS domain S-box protein [uncultured Methanoregula sp.]|uniref:response regulator n=1 Tax=uncultured Methanoregula sp. TaxID=1005933 RepID=UPI002AAB0383|nr:PAS domain S-box protein [uncultured Methanoregula sp.]